MSQANGKKQIVSPTVTHSRRIPPGQVTTQKFPVYDIGPRAIFNKGKWRFVISEKVR